MCAAGRYWLPAVATLTAVHLVGLNLRYVLEWKEQADFKEMVEDIALAKPETVSPKFNTSVGVSLEFEAPLNYYRLAEGLTWLNVADRRMKFYLMNDLYLYTADDWLHEDADSFVVLKAYPLTGARLAQRRGGPSLYNIKVDKKLDFDEPADSMATLQATSTETAALFVDFERNNRVYYWYHTAVRDGARHAHLVSRVSHVRHAQGGTPGRRGLRLRVE